MNKKTIKKAITMVFIIFIFIMIFGKEVLSTENLEDNNNNEESVFSNVIRIPAKEEKAYIDFNPDNYEPDSTTEVSNASKLSKKGNIIIKVIQVIASAASVGVLIIIAIKYMMGSVEEKAEYKKSMMPYIIGCFLVFGITNFLGIVVEIVSSSLK